MINGKEMSWKSICDLVCDRVAGKNNDDLSEADYEKINARSVELVDEVGVDEILPYAKKFMNMNILDKNVDFKQLENFPVVWHKIYSTSVDVVAVESRQIALPK